MDEFIDNLAGAIEDLILSPSVIHQ